MTARLFITTGGLFVLGAVLMALAHHRRGVSSERIKKDRLKYVVYVFIVFGFLLASVSGRWLTAVILATVALVGSIEIYRSVKRRRFRKSFMALTIPIIVLCLAHLLWHPTGVWSNSFAFLFLLVAVNDSFSQLWGQLLGRRKIWPTISPAKTLEGTVGGACSTVGAVFLLGFLMAGVALFVLVSIGIIVSFSAAAGDLCFSYIKRGLAIKDFSGILPGHGGVLDRFDSLIIAAPVYYWTGLLMMT